MHRKSGFIFAPILCAFALSVLAGCGSDPANSPTSRSSGVDPGSGGDTTPPFVSLTAPGDNSTVSGTVAVSATASDDVGVAGVQFRLDGTDIGAEDTSAPFSVSYDTTFAANGTYTLVAVARDSAGNETTSVARTVTISNTTSPPGTDTSKPLVTITAPTSQTTYTASNAAITLGGNALDNVGVTQVSWTNSRGGSGSKSFSGPSVAWSFAVTLQSGSNILTVTARDAAGNTQTDVVTVSYAGPGASFSMDVSWAPNADNPDGYNVYLAASASGSQTLVTTLSKGASGWDPAAPSLALSSTVVRNVIGPGATTACAVIRAYNAAGVSTASPSTCVSVPL